ncbi:hypothetical protein [Pararhodospirillum photometricum]|uniref:hypothetical protein n=1 Tax=Pararhodospirillum photometricum TaxID=1084 RepID=UPI0012FECB29|nr:hypothetical protein [Pararhodospirillum photometricum]
MQTERYAFGSGKTYGRSSVGLGEIRLSNKDTALAGWRDYGWDGQSAVVRTGRIGTPYPSAWATLFVGVIAGVEVGVSDVRVRLRDAQRLLDEPIQTSLYAGTSSGASGVEGGADLEGDPKPLCFGLCRDAPLVLVNGALQIYQYHDGPAGGVLAVYDKGSALTSAGSVATLTALQAATVPPGHWLQCPPLGLVRLGSTPAGQVSADVLGDATGGYADTAPGIAARLLARVGVPVGDTFSALAAAAPAPVGVYVSESRKVGETLDDVLGSVGAWCVRDGAGVWQVGRLASPGLPVAEITDLEMTDITVLTPSDDDGGVPPYRVDLQYLRCWRTQDEPAAGVTSDRKAFLSKEYRTKTALNGAIKTKHLLSPVMTRTTLLVVPEDAQAEAERLLALYGVRRDYVRVTVRFGQGDFGLFA